MPSISDLSEGQIESIKSWVAEGAQMADVQKQLKEEFDVNATYMDTRFLALDLNLEFLKEEVAEEKVSEEVVLSGEPQEPAAAPVEVLSPADGAPSVTVGIDQVAHPGSMISGTVTFSDGETGLWMIDEMGRPSIDPETEGYRPNQADLENFQAKLQHLFEKPM